MTIEEIKRALMEVKKICSCTPNCSDCPIRKGLDDGNVKCRLSDDEVVMFVPLCWEVEDWKEDSNETGGQSNVP